jgi:ABC-2 type transport system ATP-binding protein
MTPSIEVENLTKRFGDFLADDSLSFSVALGEMAGFWARTGGEDDADPDADDLRRRPPAGRGSRGMTMKDKTAVRRAIGTVSQAVTTDENLTVYENLSAGKMHGSGPVLRCPSSAV